MNSLQAFLNPEKPGNKEVVISNRFKENGKAVPFIIRAISQEENKKIIKNNTKKAKNGEETFDKQAYISELVSSAVVFPDLQNADLQKAYGVIGAGKLLSEMLLIGEYANLSNEVQKISGIDTDVNDEIEEAKN